MLSAGVLGSRNHSNNHSNHHTVNANQPDWMEPRIAQLHKLMLRHDYKGHDPFDLPNSPLLSWMPDNWRVPQLLFSKFGSRIAPGWVRQALRVPAIEDPKIYSCCYFAYRLLGDAWNGCAEAMLERLVAMATHADGGKTGGKTEAKLVGGTGANTEVNAPAGTEQSALHWGYDYTWGTLYDGVNPRRAATLVPGAFAMLALLHEVIAFSGEKYRHPLLQSLRWYATRHRRDGASGTFLGYFTTSTINTHNANVLGCLALSLGGKLIQDQGYLALAAEATQTTVAAVRDDGFIPYNDHPRGGWTDCFHHLYVVASLQGIAAVNPLVDKHNIQQKVARMVEYYRQHFLRNDGLLNYFPNRLHPIDPHNYAAAAIFAILTGDDASIQQARALLQRLDELAWNPNKESYTYRQHEGRKDERFFLRWTQVWMFFALAASCHPARLKEQLEPYSTLTKPAP